MSAEIFAFLFILPKDKKVIFRNSGQTFRETLGSITCFCLSVVAAFCCTDLSIGCRHSRNRATIFAVHCCKYEWLFRKLISISRTRHVLLFPTVIACNRMRHKIARNRDQLKLPALYWPKRYNAKCLITPLLLYDVTTNNVTAMQL